MDKNTTYIGMDLGTYKTSVTSSTGVRDVMLTAVGWPKDAIARTMLGREVVFGKDIIEHRLALNVVRPFEKGFLKYSTPDKKANTNGKVDQHKEAARLLVEHAVAQTRPPLGKPIVGVIGAPSRATAENKKVILEAARNIFDSVLIVSEPFTIAYGMNRLTDTLVIDIGAGTIDLCPIHGTFPSEEDQVTLSVGGDLVDEQFYNQLRTTYPDAQLTLNMAREIKEKYGVANDAKENAVVSLPVGGKPKQFDVTRPLQSACKMLVKAILDGLQELISRSDPEYQQRMLSNIILGGGGSQLKGLDLAIEEGLKEYGGGKVKRVGDAVFAGAVGALKLAMSMPTESWQQLQQTDKREPALAKV